MKKAYSLLGAVIEVLQETKSTGNRGLVSESDLQVFSGCPVSF